METLQHPLFRPDLSPCDFHIFGDLKKDIRGRRFHCEEEVKEWVRLWIHERPTSFYKTELIVSSTSGSRSRVISTSKIKITTIRKNHNEKVNVLTLLAITFE